MNMIEKVARAITADHYAERFNKPVDDEHVQMNVNGNWTMYVRQAKIAIAAMREPTTDVLDATMDWHNHVAADENYPMARGVMRAAVDAALEGK